MPYSRIKGKSYAYETVGKDLPKGYKRISTKSALYQAAAAVLGKQSDKAVWLHTSVCAVAHGKPPGQIGVGKGKWTVDHIDGDCRNNAASNLAWMLHDENTAKGNSDRS